MSLAKEPVIDGRDISIEYKIYRHRVSGFKDYVIQRLRGKRDFRMFHALKGVSIAVRPGESVALVGHNGCGKSTLLKVIAGILPPSLGTIHTSGRIAPMIELGAGFDYELSGLENIELSCMLLGLSKEEIAYRRPQIIEFADLGDFIDSPLKNYSSGMAARIGFACATAVEPAILLIDEVLSVGDTNFSRKCLKRIHELRNNGTTVVMVSHGPGIVREFCDRAYVLEEGQLQFEGPVHQALEEHARIMDRRALEALPREQQQEAERRRKMALLSLPTERPSAVVEALVVQDGVPTDQVNLAEAFSIKLHVSLQGNAHFRHGIAFGIGLDLNNVRVSGFNNLELGYEDPYATVAGCSEMTLEYRLDQGLPDFVEGTYGIVFAIHDDHISREIFLAKVLTFTGSNSLLGHNKHSYLTDTSRHISDFQLLPFAQTSKEAE